MANNPKNTPDAKSATDPKAQQKPLTTPESETSARIADAEKRLAVLNQEIRTAKGRLANADPMAVRAMEKENEQLRSRQAILRKALYGMTIDAEKARQPDENEMAIELLRRAAVEYFKKANVAPEIWKNIES